MCCVLGLSIASDASLHPRLGEPSSSPCSCEHPSDLLLQTKCLQSAFVREKPWETAKARRGKEGITWQLQHARGTQSSHSPGTLPHARPGVMLSLWGGDCRELGAGVD